MRTSTCSGAVPTRSCPRYAKAFDVAVCPFVQDELSRNVNPIKLREYLSAGVPVVASGFPRPPRTATRAASRARPRSSWRPATPRSAATRPRRAGAQRGDARRDVGEEGRAQPAHRAAGEAAKAKLGAAA
jgi:hypothetical protein